MATRAELQKVTYDLLNDTDTSQVYPTSVVQRTLEEEELELATRMQWDFLSAQAQYTSAQPTALSSDLDTADTTISVGATTNFDSSGYVYIDRDIITYTGLTSSTFTGVSGIQADCSSGAYVYKMYLVPSDSLRSPQLSYKPTGSTQFVDIPFVPFPSFDRDPQSVKYTLLTVGEASYIHIHGLPGGYKLNFYYQKKPTALTTDATESSFPDTWAKKIIPKRAAAKLRYIYDDNIQGEADALEQIATDEIAKMFKLYGIKDAEYQPIVRQGYRSGITESYTNRTWLLN